MRVRDPIPENFSCESIIRLGCAVSIVILFNDRMVAKALGLLRPGLRFFLVGVFKNGLL